MTDNVEVNVERSDSLTLEAAELTRLVAFVLDIKRKWTQMRFTARTIHQDLCNADTRDTESVSLLGQVITHCDMMIARCEAWLPSREKRLAALVKELVGDAEYTWADMHDAHPNK